MRIAALLLLVASTASADPSLSKVKVGTVVCETDGGSVACSNGVKYLGELVEKYVNAQLEQHPVACAGAKPGTTTLHVGYEYNDGTIGVAEPPKVSSTWAPCVQTLVSATIAPKYLEWWAFLQPIDTSIDVRSSYKVTVTIKK